MVSAAKLTFTADGSDLIKIFSGEMDGRHAFLQGKLRIAGDMIFGLKLLDLFKIQ
jgi:putative sterol carrier protein